MSQVWLLLNSVYCWVGGGRGVGFGFELFKFILTFYIHACLHMIYVKLSVTAYKFIIRKTGSYLTSRDIKFHIEYIYRYSRKGIGLNYTEICTHCYTRPNAIEVLHIIRVLDGTYLAAD